MGKLELKLELVRGANTQRANSNETKYAAPMGLEMKWVFDFYKDVAPTALAVQVKMPA